MTPGHPRGCCRGCPSSRGRRRACRRRRVVTHREPPRHDVVGREEAPSETHRLEHERGDGPFVRQAGDLLDDPSGEVVGRLAVGGPGAGRRNPLELGQLRHVVRQGVVALARVDDDSPTQPRGVVEQVQHGDLRLGRERQLRDVAADRRRQVDPAVGDQAQQRRRGVGLGDRTELEERLVVDGQRVVEARHAVTGVDLTAVCPDPDGDTRDAELRSGGLDELGQRHGVPPRT
jgi:hypothetical protein